VAIQVIYKLILNLYNLFIVNKAPIGVKFRMMMRVGRGQIFSPFGGVTPGGTEIRNPGPKFWPFDREYLENVKSRR